MKQPKSKLALQGYDQLLSGIQRLLEEARHQAARSVNAILTATYWEIGRRIVVHEQGGKARAEYGKAVLEKLSNDLTRRFGRGYSRQNIQQMREFYLSYPPAQICQTLSGKLGTRQTPSGKCSSIVAKGATVSRKFDLGTLATAFPLSWSHYVALLSVKNDYARRFYETEALRGGWSVRQLDRQMGSQFYERVALSRNKAGMLKKGAVPKAQDRTSPEEEIKDPYVLEFLGLKDEYSESDLEEALIRHLETFLLELGGDFAFVARQKRLRIGDEWYRVDLIFFHRLLRCLVLVDLKVKKFTHADAGQMHMYLNYAKEHWTHPEENPPVGLILCAKKDASAAHYALGGLPNKVLAAEYKTALPEEHKLAEELERTRLQLEHYISKSSLRK
jgi:predicted nuclease of restriction endonuclease-like (RecB) superfamily